ncbi:hypothetical protein ACROYT_G021194 [Oculina patagonica]
MSELSTLDFSHNKIEVLPEGIFQNLQWLVYLNVADNKIKSIEVGHFSNLKNLQYLFLQNNKISHIPSKAFSSHTNLEYVMLSDNPIKSISSGAFTIPNSGKLSIFMIRTDLKTVSLRSFTEDFSNLTADISMEDGQIGTLKIVGPNQEERCIVQLGLGSSEYITLPEWEDHLLEAFHRAGFESKSNSKYEVAPCSTGTFVNASVSDPDELQCLECPAGGFYSDTKAYVSEGCRKCPNGTFVPYNKAPGKKAQDCIACPQGTNTSIFAGFRACKCLDGFFRIHLFEGCKQCDQPGLKCVNDYATLESGYWWKWGNNTHKLLYEEYTMNLVNITPVVGNSSRNSSRNGSLIEYPYVLPKTHRCPRKESCRGDLDSKCDDGYEGPLCEVCSAGYYKQMQTCKTCPTKTWMAGQLSIAAAVIAIIIALVVWTSKKKCKKSTGRSTVDMILGRLKIVIGFYQVTFGVLEAFAYIKWPESLALIGKYSELLQLNVLQMAPIHCILPGLKVDAFGSLFAILALNATAITMSLVIYGLRKLFLMRSSLDERDLVVKTSQAKELIYRNLFFVLYVTYLNTCSKAASVLPLACRELCDDENEKECPKFLKADYNIICHGPEYNRLVIVAYCAVFYILLLPAVSMTVLWKQRKVIGESEADNEASHTQEPSTEVSRGLRFLFENYNSHSWYWEFVEMVRKVVLTSGLILVGGESRAYVGLACVMSGLYGMLFAYVHPILDKFENRLMLTSLAVTFVNLGIGTVSKIPKENIPASIDSYVDSTVFTVLVIGANSLVIGLLVVQYLLLVYRHIKEWRKNPQWSFSCFLAMLLPLNELQGELRGLVGRNALKQQLQTGKINMPSISNTLKDTGAMEFSLEEIDETNVKETQNNDKKADTRSEVTKITKPKPSTIYPESDVVIADIHEPPNETYGTSF